MTVTLIDRMGSDETVARDHARLGRARGATNLMTDQPYEQVDHPTHYRLNGSGVECIDVAEHMPFNTGNALKYLWRAGLKPGTDAVTDLRKAAFYVNREIERIEKAKTP